MDDLDYTPVTAAVIVKDGRILIAKRKRAYSGYLWEFPGGKMEEGESLEECLKREIEEELGIEIAVGDHLCSVRHQLNCQSAIKLYAYRATHVKGDIRLRDHDEVRWVTVKELAQYDFPEPDRYIASVLIDQQRAEGGEIF
jgi:mutator protein MutT